MQPYDAGQRWREFLEGIADGTSGAAGPIQQQWIDWMRQASHQLGAAGPIIDGVRRVARHMSAAGLDPTRDDGLSDRVSRLEADVAALRAAMASGDDRDPDAG